MNQNLTRILSISFVLALTILNCKKEHVRHPNAKIVEIPSLGLGLDYENWNFSDDPKLINQAEQMASSSDDSGKIKKALEVVGINFFFLNILRKVPKLRHSIRTSIIRWKIFPNNRESLR